MLDEVRKPNASRLGLRLSFALPLIGIAFAMESPLAQQTSEDSESSERQNSVCDQRSVERYECDYLLIVKVVPVYPTSAVARQLEGDVVVEYTITETGETRDVRVVESSMPIFESAAVEAVSKYRYQPTVPVAASGIRTRIEFRLEPE